MVVALAGGPDRLLAYTEGDGGCNGANRLPVPETLEQARTATLCLLNRERAAQGLPALFADARLTLAAQLHSDDIGKRRFYAHGNPDGAGPIARVYAQQLPPTARPSPRTSTGRRVIARHPCGSCATGWKAQGTAGTSCDARSPTWESGSASSHPNRRTRDVRGSTRPSSSAAATLRHPDRLPTRVGLVYRRSLRRDSRGAHGSHRGRCRPMPIRVWMGWRRRRV